MHYSRHDVLIEVVHSTSRRCRRRVLRLVSTALGTDRLLKHQFVPVDARRRSERLPVRRTQRRHARC